MSEPRWPDGPRLRGLMRARGHTPRTLADAAGVALATVYNALGGERRPRIDVVTRLLSALDATIADLESAPPIDPDSDPDRHRRAVARNNAAAK